MYSSAAVKTDGMVEPGLRPLHGTGLRETDVTDSFELQDRFSGGSTRVPPEVRLQVAVLEDAVDRISNLRRAASHRKLSWRETEELREVEDWVRDDSIDWPYAFEACCESLRLEPTGLRSQLLSAGFMLNKRMRKNIAGVVRTHTAPARRRTP